MEYQVGACIYVPPFFLIHENFHKVIVLSIYTLVSEWGAFPLAALPACVLNTTGLKTEHDEFGGIL